MHTGGRAFGVGVLAGGAHGLLLWLSFAPVGWWWLALVSALPLVVAADGLAAHQRALPLRTSRADDPVKKRRARTRWLLLGVAAGTVPAWFALNAWMLAVTAIGQPLFALYLSLYPALFVFLLSSWRRSAPGVPIAVAAGLAWGAVEVLRGELVLTGYPWYLLGHPLIEGGVLAAPGSVVGQYGVSVLACSLVAGLWGLWKVRRESAKRLMRRGVVPIGGVVVLWVGLGVLGLRGDRAAAGVGEGARGEIVVFGVLQTELEQSVKGSWPIWQRIEDFSVWLSMSASLALGVQPAADVLVWSDAAGRAERRVDVLVWPETMFPGDTLSADVLELERREGVSVLFEGAAGDEQRLPITAFADDLLDFQGFLGVPMVVGAIGVEGREYRPTDVPGGVEATESARFNSVFVLSGGTVFGPRYDKVELTPFGEFIPVLGRWDGLQQAVARLGAGEVVRMSLSAGESARRLRVPMRAEPAGGAGARTTGELLIATPVCFEVTKSLHCRRLVFGGGRDGVNGLGAADVIVNVSNDGWFGASVAGRRHHMQAGRWRCLELGVPMVRAVNTGFSAHVDRRGRVVAELEARLDHGMTLYELEPGGIAGAPPTLRCEVLIDRSRVATAFARWGYLLCWVLLVVGLAGPMVARVVVPVRRGASQGGSGGGGGSGSGGKGKG